MRQEVECNLEREGGKGRQRRKKLQEYRECKATSLVALFEQKIEASHDKKLT